MKEYLRFTYEIKYMENERSLLGEVNISEEKPEEVSSVGKEIKILAFAHLKCPGCSVVIAVLEAMRKVISNMNVGYSRSSGDTVLLFSYSSVAKIPGLFIVDGIKITKIISEYPESISEDIENTKLEKVKVHKG
ncbi:thioredoxin family protein, partial [Streptobacillus moniliformis]|uniref:thioredoxin family protein n=1 Tax=Streptobacillus moniliformis TaxID=34105 RepID=UPI001E3766A7